MKPRRSNSFARGCARAYAFTVVELLVAVSIMSIIVFVLYKVFNETQRALRSNIAQVDVLEAGRAAMELMTRELQEMSAAQLANQTNFYVELGPIPPVVQKLSVSGTSRTNVLEDFFFLTRKNKDWSGIGYRVINANIGIGTLARFATETNATKDLAFTNLSFQFKRAVPFPAVNPTNFHRIADGIVHLRLLAFDPNGRAMTYLSKQTNNYDTASISLFQDSLPQETRLAFRSNTLPSYVELELGVLEPQTLERFKSILNPEMARKFLEDRPGNVHLFRQRIPIRTAPR